MDDERWLDPAGRIGSEPLDERFRSLPPSELTLAGIRSAGWSVTDLVLPAMTLRRTAVEHNAERFAAWCAERGVDHAPHGKTSLAPQLFGVQLAVGAWAITAATAAQARLMHRYGVRRVLLANQVIDPAGLRVLAGELGADPDFEVMMLVDSVEGVRHADAAFAGLRRPVPVLLELGVLGGRTGVRTTAEAIPVADAVRDSQALRLAGVECFEGVLPHDRADTSVRAVDELLTRLGELLRTLTDGGYFVGADEVLLTAGGSVYHDRVAAAAAALVEPMPVRVVVRSGGYLTHDDGMLAETSPLRADLVGEQLGLRPALELWAVVQSTPEPGLAMCGFGKRDAPYDSGLPVPLERRGPDGTRTRLADSTVVKLNDQHAYVRHTDPLAVGDVVRLGISHPCTAFDKWSLLPVLDDADRVVDAVRTFF